MDVLTPEQRTLNMRMIKGRDTKPEILIRKALHRAGMRYKLHVASIPGRPDIVFPRYRAIVQVNGCFWHGHDCPLFRLPSTRREFWEAKINGNRVRDQATQAAQQEANWRAFVVWECSLKGPGKRPFAEVIAACIEFIRGTERTGEIKFALPKPFSTAPE